MSKFAAGQKVVLHIPSIEAAQSKAIHVIDEKQPLSAEVVFVNEDGTVNILVVDQVGTLTPLLNIQTSKPKEDDVFYVSSVK